MEEFAGEPADEEIQDEPQDERRGDNCCDYPEVMLQGFLLELLYLLGRDLIK